MWSCLDICCAGRIADPKEVCLPPNTSKPPNVTSLRSKVFTGVTKSQCPYQERRKTQSHGDMPVTTGTEIVVMPLQATDGEPLRKPREGPGTARSWGLRGRAAAARGLLASGTRRDETCVVRSCPVRRMFSQPPWETNSPGMRTWPNFVMRIVIMLIMTMLLNSYPGSWIFAHPCNTHDVSALSPSPFHRKQKDGHLEITRSG